ncbi:MAG: hypothetical protein Q7J29_06180 [Stagnimonas sp.]|nr:hypothetical protein [Stagnimonas sp.]
MRYVVIAALLAVLRNVSSAFATELASTTISVMAFSDDDGAIWIPNQGGPFASAVDPATGSGTAAGQGRFGGALGGVLLVLFAAAALRRRR